MIGFGAVDVEAVGGLAQAPYAASSVAASGLASAGVVDGRP